MRGNKRKVLQDKETNCTRHVSGTTGEYGFKGSQLQMTNLLRSNWPKGMGIYRI